MVFLIRVLWQIVTGQVDRLKGFRLKVTGRGSRGVQAEGIQVEGLRLVYLVYSVCLVYLVEPDRPASA